ncbi:MAG: hypothetical protein LBK53_01635 [Heliobacteriaceae bacterium]|jgi:hypothetical protein|nr:hypothetical protein [Heliobacteriaceae bacterium]
MNFDNGVEFDPGFSKHIQAFIPNIEYIYAEIGKFKNFGQKKLQFKVFYPKIQTLLSNYIAFYLGCMLWASYIKTLGSKPVLNNHCFGGNYSGEEEVDFILGCIERLPKDVKYYLGQSFSVDSAGRNITEAYREFVKLNRGFTQIQTTDDIKLPEGLKPVGDEVRAKIEEVTETGKLTQLYSLYEKLF